MRYRRFGNTGIDISALGFGCMRLPIKQDKTIDEEQAIAMIRHGIDEGINYIDTAYMYHNYQSETLVGKALQDGYREKVYLATKAPVALMHASEDFERILDEQLEKLQTDHIDFYLLHCLTKVNWYEKSLPWGFLDKLETALAQGKIKHVGFSFHDDFDTFKAIIDAWDKWEFCQIQMNYVDVNRQATLKGLEYAHEKGLGVVIMEPLLGGKLANPTERMKECFGEEKTPVEWALDFLWDRKEVSFLLSGMSAPKQVEDNLTYANRSSVGMLNDEQREQYQNARDIFWNSAKVGCTKCEYCMPCPFGLQIPQTFEIYNQTALPHQEEACKKAYHDLPVQANQCQQCGHCMQECPQHLPIIDFMQEIAAYFE